ncbi:1-aminocyclopropane-1-carboxylate oxidase-like protein 1 [Forsythia ovata]|uniref:1-aminocyclopropane-1-carboxylate oxidase-like protein 1 n=1 Tax=Forsythia ovata TaxID=205694 RepID=A0ABD1V0E6_9LAMI
MVTSSRKVATLEDDRIDELKAFDDTKAGVKGLVDSKIVKIPRIFIHEKSKINQFPVSSNSRLSVPIIDFAGIDEDETRRSEIINKIRDACERWGFFQIINHGIPTSVMDEMMDAVSRFHEQDTEVKKQYYSRDFSKKFIYNSNFDLYQGPAAYWRDGFECILAPHPPEPEELPVVCRGIMAKYANYVMSLGITLFELLSQALGLKPHHLNEMNCSEGLLLLGNYYPACPEPELTAGLSSHTDSGFLTILQQDQIGGLQVLHENQWIDAPSLPGVLIVNIADLLQLITNDKFKSVHHRVLAKKTGPRISVACFFRTHFQEGTSSRPYGPIKELLSDENPPIYKEITIKEFIVQRYKNGLNGISALSSFKLHNHAPEN